MNYLSVEEILALHHRVIEDYGGSHGVRDEGRLLTDTHAPQQTVSGSEQYKLVYEKVAVYFHNIIADHPFIDGNKRTATTVMAIFLDRNNRTLTCSPKELEDYAVQIATDKLAIADVSRWLQQHSQ